MLFPGSLLLYVPLLLSPEPLTHSSRARGAHMMAEASTIPCRRQH